MIPIRFPSHHLPSARVATTGKAAWADWLWGREILFLTGCVAAGIAVRVMMV